MIPISPLGVEGVRTMSDMINRIVANVSASAIVERVASNFQKQAAGLTVGQTFESDKWRIHRFMDNIKVLNIELAGKRGKKCPMWIVSAYDHTRKDRAFDLMEEMTAEFVALAK